jgi:ribosomal protein S18 acetylase RimI-like enzyme
MSPADKTALMKILENTPEFKPYEVVVAEEVIDGYLEAPETSGYNILIAEVDKDVAGYIAFGPTPCTVGTWDVFWIAVDRSRRGHGIGKALDENVDEQIRQADGRIVMIETSSTPLYDNTRNFYLGRGYQIVGRIPDFYAPGDDMIIMQKRLK